MNYASKIGLGVAIDYALQWGLEATWTRISTVANTLRARLKDVRGAAVHDLGLERCGIVSFTLQGKDPETIRHALAQERINVSVSDRNSTLLDMDARGLSSVARASVHYYNSEDEVEKFSEKLGRIEG